MKKLYHLTKKSNLESILKHGLIPKIGEKSREAGENIPRIYFFKSIEDAEYALVNWFDDEEVLCLLEINLPSCFKILEGEVDYEVYSYNVVSPEYIKYLREE